MVLKILFTILTIPIIGLSACKAAFYPVPQISPVLATNALYSDENISPDSQVVVTETLPPPKINTIQLTPTQIIFGVSSFPPGINPLTGLPAPDPELLERRPVMVKVSNFPAVGRPHAGLSFADIVFEYYIGEWTNRFLAIYYSQDAEKVWPLRSGRLVDAQLVNMYQGILAYGGADEQIDKVLSRELMDRAVSWAYSPCPPICGELTHSATGVYVSTAEITKYANKEDISNTKPYLDGMIFDDQIPASDQLAVMIGIHYIRFNRGEWHYDPSSQLYLRWIESWECENENRYPMIPLTDELTGEQLAYANLIILFAEYTELAPTLHAIEIWDNTEGKRAVFFRDGVMVDGFWRSVDHHQPIRFTDQLGVPIALKPGNSWIVIAGISSSFEELADGQWELVFDVP